MKCNITMLNVFYIHRAAMKIMQEYVIEMGNQKACAFTNCWGCNHFVIINQEVRMFILL